MMPPFRLTRLNFNILFTLVKLYGDESSLLRMRHQAGLTQ